MPRLHSSGQCKLIDFNRKRNVTTRRGLMWYQNMLLCHWASDTYFIFMTQSGGEIPVPSPAEKYHHAHLSKSWHRCCCCSDWSSYHLYADDAFLYGQTCQKKQDFILETGSVLNLLTKGDLSWPPCDYDYIPNSFRYSALLVGTAWTRKLSDLRF